MQYTPYILPLILADLLAADGGPEAKVQTLAAALLNQRFDLRSNYPNPFNVQTTL